MSQSSTSSLSTASFGERFREITAARGRLCVGIDPHPQLLAHWGLPISAAGITEFGLRVAEAIASDVAAIKPQVALFECFGAAGFTALETVIKACQEQGTLVISDAKRGDIGSTMEAYSRAWLSDDSPLASDAVTLSPYLGFGSLRPAVDLAARNRRGVFVLARTSNPEGGEIQTATTKSDRAVAQTIVDTARVMNAQHRGTVGIVVGATNKHGLDLSMLNGPVLAPGLGAQGAAAADLPKIFSTLDPAWLLPTSSREILAFGPIATELKSAALSVRDEVERVLV